MSSCQAPDRVNAREVPLEISQPVFPPDSGVRRPKEARNVLAVPSLDAALEDLDVLLRHRPRSIPRGLLSMQSGCCFSSL